jgi:hypothetical protein
MLLILEEIGAILQLEALFGLRTLLYKAAAAWTSLRTPSTENGARSPRSNKLGIRKKPPRWFTSGAFWMN